MFNRDLSIILFRVDQKNDLTNAIAQIVNNAINANNANMICPIVRLCCALRMFTFNAHRSIIRRFRQRSFSRFYAMTFCFCVRFSRDISRRNVRE